MNFKSGDLVMVVKPVPCCGQSRLLGKVFVVAPENVGSSVCTVCGHFYLDNEVVTLDGILDGYQIGAPPSILRLIPPLSDDAETTREMEAA